MTRLRPWIASTVLLLAVLQGQIACAGGTAGQEAFDRGVAAFRDDDFEGALQAFLAARAAGMDSGILRYNLGATYYRLGRYAPAETEFRPLIDDPGAAPAAHYNLGLIARQRGDMDLAGRHFRTARDTAGTSGLQALAQAALEGIDDGAGGARHRRVLLSLAGGYDDNVTLAPQADLLGVSEVDDRFLELLAAARYRLWGDASDSLRLDTGLYLREYVDVDRFDQTALRLGAVRLRPVGEWHVSLGGHADVIFLGGDHFENIFSASLDGVRKVVVADELWMRYRLSRIEAIDAFDRLTGWRHRARAEGRWRRAAADIYLGYELEWNDRNDLRRGTDFQSLSPLRNTPYAEAFVPLSARWESTARFEYRHSRYRDRNTTASGTTRRLDRQRWFSLRIDRRFDGGRRLFAVWTWADNDSTIDSFDYSRNEFLAGPEWSF